LLTNVNSNNSARRERRYVVSATNNDSYV
jgi:hypothetical protein